jgi:PAS domain S-box-containing protein
MNSDHDETTQDDMRGAPLQTPSIHNEAAWHAAPAVDTHRAAPGGERSSADMTRYEGSGAVLSFRSTTEQKAAAHAKRASESYLRAILDTAPDSTIAIDANGYILEFNQAAQRTFGYSRQEALGQPAAELVVPPDLREQHRKGLSRFLKSGREAVLGRRLALRGMRKDGMEFPIELTITRLPVDGQPTFIAHLRDITDQAQADAEHAALLERERHAREESESARLRFEFLAKAGAILASSLDYGQSLTQLAWMIAGELADVCFVDLLEEDGTITRLPLAHRDEEKLDMLENIRARRSLTRAPAYPLLRVIQSGESLLVVDTADEAFVATSDYERETLEGLRALGYRSMVSVPMRARGDIVGTLTLLAGESGRVFGPDDLALAEDLGWRAGLAIDNTRLFQQTQRVLHQVEEYADQFLMQATQLDAVIQAIPGVVFVCDAQGHITRVNPSGAAMLGADRGAVSGPGTGDVTDESVFSPDGNPLARDEHPLARALRGETSTDFRCMMRRFDTSEDVQLLVSFASIRDGGGAITGAVAVGNDVTAIYRQEQQKDDFLSIASHELKTPLTSLKILAQLTRRRLTRGGVKEAEQLAGMERSIERMERLVNDLLDVTRIQERKLALRLESCDLVTIARQVAAEQMAATERPITLDLPSEPVMTIADSERIGQVLTNLLSNALKYSSPGCPVWLKLEVVPAREAHFVVKDEGAGIPPGLQTHLFERFYRVPGVQVQSGSGVGLGLGLYISREIVERHGGRMSVESGVGQGAAFHVTLPL